MKRKPQTKSGPKGEPVDDPLNGPDGVAPEIRDAAKRGAGLEIAPDVPKTGSKCVVCGGESATAAADEQLCWVCRRLKISAWRDVEQQMPAQE